MKSVSVIIPCFNFGDRIKEIVSEIRRSPYVGEIIVVDDGSNKKTKATLRKISGITLLTHKKNRGKTAALLTGYKKSKGDIIAFIDEDLVNFSSSHLNALIEPVLEGTYEATMSDREKEWWLTKWTGFPTAYTGERVMPRKIINDHPEIFNVSGFRIEPSMNKIIFRKYSVAKVFFSGVGQVAKLKKRGPRGLVADARMFFQIVHYLGMKELLFQLYHIRRIPKLSV